eukprot:TRINITY_DN40358_c0_g1_i1.p1 TRINITY_DN40358_c0_g1~~TRINITY_DN40358_c0_g1_i1.p1  ORF type:complete len:442 (+),score=107.47 TRINITY_DN40358_c0_g1_i1:174-1328(+)
MAISGMSPSERAMAMREAALLRQLNHPNVVRYHDSFHTAGRLHLVTDYCPGGDLASFLAERKGVLLRETTVLDWSTQVCLGLCYLHSRLVLHRDVKPANIFLSSSGVAKLGDFGVSSVLSNTLQQAFTFCGTPHYMSPELCEGSPYDARSDVWSLGVTMYEMMALRLPFEARTLPLLRLRIMCGDTAPLPRRYSADLRSLCGQMMVDAGSRPRAAQVLSIAFVRARIRVFLQEQAAPAPSPARPAPPASAPRRHRRAPVAAPTRGSPARQRRGAKARHQMRVPGGVWRPVVVERANRDGTVAVRAPGPDGGLWPRVQRSRLRVVHPPSPARRTPSPLPPPPRRTPSPIPPPPRRTPSPVPVPLKGLRVAVGGAAWIADGAVMQP